MLCFFFPHPFWVPEALLKHCVTRQQERKRKCKPTSGRHPYPAKYKMRKIVLDRSENLIWICMTRDNRNPHWFLFFLLLLFLLKFFTLLLLLFASSRIPTTTRRRYPLPSNFPYPTPVTGICSMTSWGVSLYTPNMAGSILQTVIKFHSHLQAIGSLSTQDFLWNLVIFSPYGKWREKRKR